MIDINNLLNTIKNKNMYKLQVKNKESNNLYGYITNIEELNNIIYFNYIDYFTQYDNVYQIKNNINTTCTIIEPDKMRGIFVGIIRIDE
jgi:hypothetical protein